jgi:PAS domain S-box-containing protein
MKRKPTYEELVQRVEELEREVTNLNSAKAPLKGSDNFYKSIFETVPVSVALVEKNGQIVDVNAYHLSHVGKGLHSKEHYLSENILTYPSMVEAGLAEEYKKVLEGETIHITEAYFPTLSGGTDGYFTIKGVPLLKDHEVIGAVFIHEDRTEQKKTEIKLRENENRLKMALETANEGLWELYPQTGEVHLDHRLSTLLDYEKDEIQKSYGSWLEHLHPDDLPRISKGLNDFLENKEQNYSNEFRVRTKNGDWRSILMRGKAVEWDKNGGITRIVGMHLDLTERRQAEEALLESEREYRNLFNSIPDPVIIIQEDSSVQFNKTLTQLFGYDQKDVINLPDVLDAIPEKDKKIIQKRIENRLAGRPIAPDLFSFEVLSKEGRSIPCEGRGTLIQYKGKPADLIVLRDITERKNAEKALFNSQAKFRDLVETVNDIIWEVDHDANFTYISPRVHDVLGYYPDELVGRPFYDKMTSEEYIRFSHIFSKFKKRPKPFTSLESNPLHKDGHKIILENSAKPFFRSDGAFRGFRGICRDVTERKEAEDLIHTLTHQLIEAQENERQMISRELHDTVAQDLSSTKINSEGLLEYKSLTSGAREKISQISHDLHDTLMTIRDLSYYLKPPGLEKLGLVQPLYQFCKEFSEKNDVQVDFQAAGIENVSLSYDIKLNLYRLAQEGLNNVRKHAGAKKVAVKLVASFPDIILRIEDDGKGFDLKQRLAESPGEKRLGLRSMQERVRLIQGRMSIDSIVGKGTKVIIKIPYTNEKLCSENTFKK